MPTGLSKILRVLALLVASLLVFNIPQLEQVSGIQPVSTGAEGKNPSLHGSIIAFSTPEAAVQTDLNVDGDLFDNVIRYYDLATGLVTNTAAAGDNPSVYGNVIVFRTPRGVIQYYDIEGRRLFNTTVVGEEPKVWGDMIVFAGNDQKLRIYNVSSGSLENIGVFGSNPTLDGRVIAFSTVETLVNTDLDGDGTINPFTSVVRFYDLSTRAVVNTGAVGDRTSVYNMLIAFDYALNAPIRLYNITSGEVINTGAVGFTPTIYGDHVFLENGTIRQYVTSSGASTDTRIDGTSPSAFKNLVAFETDENIVNKDLNGDQIVKDVVIRYFELPLRDIAVTSLVTSTSDLSQPRISLTATVANLGDSTESSILSFFWNSTVIGTVSDVSLQPGASASVTIEWETGSLGSGTYFLSVKAAVVGGESETVNNLFLDGTLSKVMVCSLEGDVNRDGIVNILDLVTVGGAFGKREGEAGYNPEADLNSDGIINILDLVIVGGNFGKTC